MNPELFRLYKPLKNHIDKVSVENALYVIWAYINYCQFAVPFPKDIQVHPQILTAKDIPSRGVYEWELSLLAREILSRGQTQHVLAKESFGNYSYFSSAINKLKEFENNAWPTTGGTSVLRHEFRRISHRQFPWQFKITSSNFVRYYKIYSNQKIRDLILETIGINIQAWYTIGTAIMGAILSNPKIKVDSKIAISTITKDNFDTFLKFTSTNLIEFQKIIKEKIDYNDEYIYTLNPLEYYPLVEINGNYYCPVINFLAWRITSGLFFDMIKNKKFGQPFGLAFQDYLVEISDRVLDKGKTTITPEAKYGVGKEEKDSIDIIISQPDSILFLEAKAKRMQAKAKTQLSTDAAINEDLNILADEIVQMYLTLMDFMEGKYLHFKYSEKYIIYPLIVTLEDWYLIGEDLKELNEKVSDKLKERGMSAELLKASPYTLCSARFYEILIQVINTVPIKTVMTEWFQPERGGHDFGNFIATTYGKNCKEIDDFFPGDFEKIYPKPIMDTGNNSTTQIP